MAPRRKTCACSRTRSRSKRLLARSPVFEICCLLADILVMDMLYVLAVMVVVVLVDVAGDVVAVVDAVASGSDGGSC